MGTATGEIIQHLLVLLVLIFVAGMAAGKIASWLKLPDVVVFILIGMVLGQGLHWIHETSSSVLNQTILTAGSTLILFDGGRNIGLHGLRKVWVTVSLLSVPGVLITVGVVGAAAHYLFGLEWILSLLVGAVIASTDPASIIPVFRQVKIQDKVRETVESESAFNDATGSIITFTLLAVVLGQGSLEAGPMVVDFLKTAVGGILVGVLVAFPFTYLTGHARFAILREYTTIAMIVVALAAYLVGDLLHVSGFMATFVAGLIWGNEKTFGLSMHEKRQEMDHFADNITVLMRMLIFILLGSQVNFSVLIEYFWPSLIVVLVLMFIARPLTVIACALPDRKAKWTWREMAFMVWVRETGVIPAALSGMIAASGVEHADIIASVTFMAIMLTILVQASSTAWMARKLGLEVHPNK
ncbi:cation:proton antiporter [Paenibacillus guangzhouensis]|uniref:cation:proton antiporter n=1 Tax=Paenibacillus guangzhouensis TaxID=1473112 RepID=UPI0012672141|nr:cation:proton antiporter [Paenibacillus guangzhouensis]